MSIITKARNNLANLIGGTKYRLGGSAFFDMLVPPAWGHQRYLQSYGTIGWLFRGASVIAHAVAQEDWVLLRQKANGEEEVIENHALVEMFDKVNPFLTMYEYMYLQSLYMILAGESFTVLDFKGNIPAQMWSAIPNLMALKRSSANEYLSYYEYTAGGTTIRLELAEVIHVRNPNPANPLRGIGAGQAMSADLGVETYATRYQERLFYNDATPGLTLEFPDTPVKAERDALREEWRQQHQGWTNARKTAFLWGGAKANTVTMTNRELDFWRSTQHRGDKILAILGVPKIIAGIPEGTNRATAEVATYVFAKYTIKPILTQFREAFNEQLIPLFGDSGIYIDFTDPVPENREALINEAERGVKAGFVTINEAREMIGLESVKNGDVFLQPMTMLAAPVGPTPKGIKISVVEPKQFNTIPCRNFETEEQKEAYWRSWVIKGEQYEKNIIAKLREMFEDQEKEAWANYSIGQESYLIDSEEAKERCTEILMETLTPVLAEAIADAEDLIHPQPGHRAIKQEQEFPINEEAREWLRTRIGWVAAEVGEVTGALLEEALKDALATGFEAGEGMADIAVRVQGAFRNTRMFCSDIRALSIARTEIVMASNEGALGGYETSGVVKAAEFYAALDERACDDCLALHNEQFDLQDAHGMIPLHPMCRCVWLPIVV